MLGIGLKGDQGGILGVVWGNDDDEFDPLTQVRVHAYTRISEAPWTLKCAFVGGHDFSKVYSFKKKKSTFFQVSKYDQFFNIGTHSLRFIPHCQCSDPASDCQFRAGAGRRDQTAR